MLPTPADVLKTMMKHIDPTVVLQDDALILITDVPLQCTQHHPMAACFPFECDDFHSSSTALHKMIALPDLDDAYHTDDSGAELRLADPREPDRKRRRLGDCVSRAAESPV
jgi:hypothetical protein